MRRMVLIVGLLMMMDAQAGWRDIQIQRTVNNIKALNSYQGVLVQQGLFDEPVEAKVRFQRPHDFHSEVIVPDALQGAITRYTDQELLTWLPSAAVAVRVVNLPPAPAGREADRIADAWRENSARNFYALGPVRRVAGHETIELEQRARSGAALLQSGLTQVYDRYSFPLSGRLDVRGGAKFEYQYRQISFNQSVDIPEPPTLPPDTMLIEWDLEWPNQSHDALGARMPAASLPQQVLGLPAERRLIHPGPLPSVGVYYTDNNYFILLTASRDLGATLPGSQYGLPVPIGSDLNAQLVLSPVINSWSFSTGEVAYTVMTNQHPEKVYEWLQRTNW